MRTVEHRKSNAHRLVCVLFEYKDDERALSLLAHALGYHKPQLKDDIEDLSEYLKALEADKEEAFDLKAYEQAMKEHRENPKTYTLDEIEKELDT